MRIRAAALHAVNAPLQVESLDVAPPARGEVLVAIGASGVCHPDFHVISALADHDLPAVLGHEGADGDFLRYAELYLNGELPLDDRVARRYPIDDVNIAIADMMNGLTGRGVIIFGGVPSRDTGA